MPRPSSKRLTVTLTLKDSTDASYGWSKSDTLDITERVAAQLLRIHPHGPFELRPFKRMAGSLPFGPFRMLDSISMLDSMEG